MAAAPGAAKELAPLGVTFGQARVMRVLARAGQPIRMADLAATLEIVPRSVTTMIDTLEEAGLACREPDLHDRRCVLVTPTSAGHAVVERLDRARRATAEELFGRFTAASAPRSAPCSARSTPTGRSKSRRSVMGHGGGGPMWGAMRSTAARPVGDRLEGRAGHR